MTMAALGYQDKTAYGARAQTLEYAFELPRGWQLDDSPTFVLKFAHAILIDPTESVIDVYLNGKPIGSTLLTQENASKGKLELLLPERLLQTGLNRLDIGVQMSLPDSDSQDKCRALDDERAWTLISSESDLHIPYLVADLPPDLEPFPRPFSDRSGLGHTIFVPPDTLSGTMIGDLVQLAAQVGRKTRTEYFAIRVAYAAEVEGKQETWQDRHLVAIGRPTANGLLGTFNASLPQPFVEGKDELKPVETAPVAFRTDPGLDIGVLEITYSPWNPEYTLLAITGTSDEGVHMAMEALAEPEHGLEGNLVLVQPALGGPSDARESQISSYVIEVQRPTRPGEEATTDQGSEKEETSEGEVAKSVKILLAERWW
jgi:hypothetical protein